MRALTSRWLLGAAVAAWTAAVVLVGRPGGDFANYWTAAALWREGADLTLLFDYRWFTGEASRLGFGDRLVGFPVLTPPSALIMAPLLPLGPGLGGLAWGAFEWVLGIVAAVTLAHAVDRPAWVGFLPLALLAPAFHGHLQQGQTHLLVLAALSVGGLAWVRGREGWAGACWALAVGLKVHAWPLLLVVLLARRWRAVGSGTTVLAVGATASVLLLGWPVHAAWLEEIAPSAATGWFMYPWHPGMQSLGSVLRHLLVPHPGLNPDALADQPATAAGLPVFIEWAGVGLVASAALSFRRLDAGDRWRLLAAASFVALATGPLISRYHLVAVAPAVAWGGDALWRQGRRGRAGVVCLLVAAAAWVDAPPVWPAGWSALLLGVPRFWLLVAANLLLVPWRAITFWPGVPWVVIALVSLASAEGGPRSRSADGACPVDGPGFPLVASELVMTEDGTLWFSGLPTDRQGRPGHGWVGYRLNPDEGAAEIVVSDPEAHAWAPEVVGAAQVSWRRGPAAEVGAAGGTSESEVVACIVDGQSEICRRDGGALQPLTTSPAWDGFPVLDMQRGRVWFLSDRGVGVRALRLWWVALPDPDRAPVDLGDPTSWFRWAEPCP